VTGNSVGRLRPLPGMRVTDEMVRTALTWARNYEEIESYQLIANSGRKWRVTLPQPVLVGAPLLWSGLDPDKVVPDVLLFTSREAMAFAYGCAAGGGRHGRADFARDRWGWD
jgi:hypothetical protein